MNEDAVTSHSRLEFANIGPLWRNNSGAFKDDTGRLIRFGLGHESAATNAEMKSSDYIGITPVVAYLASLQRWATLGVFTALEMKPGGWKLNPSDKRGHAQANFHRIVREAGGFAGFVTDPKDVHKYILRG